jgi:glycosyltransferase involved in cell wall biosynthesis
LRGGESEIVHTGDPQLARGMHRRRRRHRSTAVYKHGPLLGPHRNRHSDWVQVLAPHHLDAGKQAGIDTGHWRVIPHFVELDRFQARQSQAEIRPQVIGLNIPSNAERVLAAGALAGRSHKRLDRIVREVAEIPDAHLLVVGQAKPADEAAFETMARPLLKARRHVRINLLPEAMPACLPAADLFAHAALQEPSGIVLLEALASGLPVLGHTFPATRWIIGNGGASLDLQAPGALASTIRDLLASPDRLHSSGEAARQRARGEFSPEASCPATRRCMRTSVRGDWPIRGHERRVHQRKHARPHQLPATVCGRAGSPA